MSNTSAENVDSVRRDNVDQGAQPASNASNDNASTNNNNARERKMRQDEMVKDVAALLRARNTLLWIVTQEEVRVERALISVATSEQIQMLPIMWDCCDGLVCADGTVEDESATDCVGAFKSISDDTRRALYVMRDLHLWLNGDATALRTLRSLARKLSGTPKESARAVVVLAPTAEVPAELSDCATVINWPSPDRAEMEMILDDAIKMIPASMRDSATPINGQREAAVEAALGLTAKQAESAYAKSLVTRGKFDAAVISAEKKRIVESEGVLSWEKSLDGGMDAVGGLDLLKDWLRERRNNFSAAAREYGITAPKGMILVGPAGTGKSLTAKAVATAWSVPLLRMDMGALKSKYVGESEQNIRKALQVAEDMAPCVLWVDEIEKALAGSTGPQGDGGVSADALGALLTWMQDRAGSVFVVATSNDVQQLPDALLRKGRFDEMFFVDLPTSVERAAIIRGALKSAGRADLFGDADINAIVAKTAGFTGAEMASLVPDALRRSFADNARELTTEDVVVIAERVVPRTNMDALKELRGWAVKNCTFASTPEQGAMPVSNNGAARTIEL